MMDRRLIERLRAMPEPDAAPRADFADALFERLVVESGLHGRRRWAIPIATIRLALLVAAVIIALLTAAFVGGRRVGPSPGELAERSRALYTRPPAFEAIVRVGPDRGSRRIASDGHGTWRVDILDSAEAGVGTSTLWSPDGPGATWDPADQAWRPVPAGEPPPFPLQTEIAWSVGGAPGSLTCPDWSEVGSDAVAGRAAIHLRCGERDQDFWLDRETLLVLQVRAGPLTPDWTDGAGISLSEPRLGSVDQAAFVASPVADHPADWPSNVDVGQRLPEWAGVTLDGDAAGTGSSTGLPQVILVWASWCPPCLEDALPIHRTLPQRTDVHVVTIAIEDTPESVRDALREAGARLPTVVDDGSIKVAFGARAVPTLILVDAKGVVRAVALGPVDPRVLEQAIDTLAAGGNPVLPSAAP